MGLFGVLTGAAQCARSGLTDSNYKGLTQLYDKYKGQGMIWVPCIDNTLVLSDRGNHA